MILPMLAKDSGLKPPSLWFEQNAEYLDRWTMEPKLDGIRMIWERDENGIRAWGGRNGKEHATQARRVNSLLKMPVGTVLDSEWTIEGGGSPEVMSLADRGRRAYVFDVLAVGDRNVRGLPWTERRELLEGLSEKWDDSEAVLIPSVEPDVAVYEEWVEVTEGAVVKEKKSSYKDGSRSVRWTKLKPQETTEAIVIGWEYGKGKSNQHKCGALLIRLVDTGQETSTGCSATPEEAEAMIGKCLEIRHHGWTRHGKVRHPVKHRWRPDRDQ